MRLQDQQYKLEPSPSDLEQGIMAYEPVEHSHRWAYITIWSTTYINQLDLVDWDNGIEEWNTMSMGHWPFGNLLSEEGLLQREMMDCLDNLDSVLDFEEWVMDQEEAALDDDDDDDESDESDDEGYIAEEESDSEEDNINFGLAPMLMHNQL